MNRSFVLSLILLVLFQYSPMVFAQEISSPLKPFSRIIASPHIDLVLTSGDSESVRIEYNGVPESKVNVEVQGRTLRLFLDDARMTDKLRRDRGGRKRSVYEGVAVIAYITYRDLDRLEVRGTQSVTCASAIESGRKFKLKAYGTNRITLTKVRADYFKAVLYGENRLTIDGGKCEFQKYKLYGENRIEASGLKSYAVSATSFGENEVALFTQDELRVTAFGDTRVSYTGDATVSRGLIIGRTDIRRDY